MERMEFINQTQGYIGVVKIRRTGEEYGVAVEPGGRVFLTLDEQILTAQAPRDPKDNPFVAQPFRDFDRRTGEVIAEGVRPPLVAVEQPRQTPARPLAVGSYAAGEEPSTPLSGS